jgi:hypothetical protein
VSAAGLGPPPRFARVPALLISLLVVAATVWPALRDPPRDSFPLSTYPMFSSLRETAWVHVVVGFDADGGEHRVAPKMIANAEVMQAAQTIAKAVRRKQVGGLCAQVAERVGSSGDYAGLVRLEVQSRQFDPRTYFTSADGATPLRLRRRARCEVTR